MKVNDFRVSLRHTKKVEINPDAHELPPDWGPFDEFKVADFNCPAEWSKDGYFVSVEEGMPLWVDLRFNTECAVVLSVQRFNPVSNEPANLNDGLKKEPTQNYMILPSQQWIDGYTKEGKVYQFVVTKAGEGLAVNEFVLPKEMQDSHAIGLAFYLPKHPKRHDIIDGRIDRTAYQLGARNRVADNYNEVLPDGANGPMWFSPIHTPQNWQITRGMSGGNPTTGQFYSNVTTKGLTNCSGEVKCSSAAIAGAARGGDEAACESIDLLDTEMHGIDSDEGLMGDSLDPDSVDMLEEQRQQEFDKASMGAGGRIDQEIETDPNTVEYYQEKPALVLPIYLSLPGQFKHIMGAGKRQDANKKDKFIHSGQIGGVQVPLAK